MLGTSRLLQTEDEDVRHGGFCHVGRWTMCKPIGMHTDVAEDKALTKTNGDTSPVMTIQNANIRVTW